MAPLTSAFGPFMSFMSDIYGDWSDVMVEVEVDHINGETSPILFEKRVVLRLLREKDVTAK